MGRINPPGYRSDRQERVAMVFLIGHQSKIVENSVEMVGRGNILRSIWDDSLIYFGDSTLHVSRQPTTYS